MRLCLFGWGALALVGTFAARAQDLTWTDLEMATPPFEAATQWKISGRRSTTLPDRIEKLSEYAYGEIKFTTDAKGRGLTRAPRATIPWLLDAMDENLRDMDIKPVAGKVSPQELSETQFYVIFNPADASPKKSDSVPRLLSVRSAVIPGPLFRAWRKERGEQPVFPDGTWVSVQVDEMGKVTHAETAPNCPEELREAATSAVLLWKFSPARKNGSAISTTVAVPILFDWPDKFEVSELSRPPRAVKQVRPTYPLSERRRGLRGEVRIQFVVTKHGDVQDAVVVQSNNPAFNDSALEAVRAWKFEPGLINDRPVNSRMMVPMIFDLNDGDAQDRYTVTDHKRSGLPAELQNDYPPKVKNVALGVYPFEELRDGKSKKVTMKFVVTPQGRVVFNDHPDQALTPFEYAARAMLEEFEFIPAAKDGRPNWGLLKMDVDFNDLDQVPVSASARRILRELKKKEPAIVAMNKLDEKLTLVMPHAPLFPTNLEGKQPDGKAEVEFYVDEEGKAQLPRVVSASDPSFGYAAAQAVSQWKFKPPTQGGKPVTTRARVPVVFKPTLPVTKNGSDATPSS